MIEGINVPYSEGGKEGISRGGGYRFNSTSSYFGDVEYDLHWEYLLNISSWEEEENGEPVEVNAGVEVCSYYGYTIHHKGTEECFCKESFHMVEDLEKPACRISLVEIERIIDGEVKTPSGYYISTNGIKIRKDQKEFIIQFEWYFPGKTEWVKFGIKKSYELLKKYEADIPTWLGEKVRGFRVSGKGWKVIN